MATMIDVKQAVQAARNYLFELYEDEDIKDVLLEEVELSDDEDTWKITLGFWAPKIAPPRVDSKLAQQMAAIMGAQYDRKYKMFTVDASTGAVKSMKDRTISWNG
jgi:hypothetical protein